MADSIWQQFSDEGDSVRLVTCRLCGAAVKTSPGDKELHERWHELIDRRVRART